MDKDDITSPRADKLKKEKTSTKKKEKKKKKEQQLEKKEDITLFVWLETGVQLILYFSFFLY